MKDLTNITRCIHLCAASMPVASFKFIENNEKSIKIKTTLDNGGRQYEVTLPKFLLEVKEIAGNYFLNVNVNRRFLSKYQCRAIGILN